MKKQKDSGTPTCTPSTITKSTAISSTKCTASNGTKCTASNGSNSAKSTATGSVIKCTVINSSSKSTVDTSAPKCTCIKAAPIVQRELGVQGGLSKCAVKCRDNPTDKRRKSSTCCSAPNVKRTPKTPDGLRRKSGGFQEASAPTLEYPASEPGAVIGNYQNRM